MSSLLENPKQSPSAASQCSLKSVYGSIWWWLIVIMIFAVSLLLLNVLLELIEQLYGWFSSGPNASDDLIGFLIWGFLFATIGIILGIILIIIEYAWGAISIFLALLVTLFVSMFVLSEVVDSCRPQRPWSIITPVLAVFVSIATYGVVRLIAFQSISMFPALFWRIPQDPYFLGTSLVLSVASLPLLKFWITQRPNHFRGDTKAASVSHAMRIYLEAKSITGAKQVIDNYQVLHTLEAENFLVNLLERQEDPHERIFMEERLSMLIRYRNEQE